MDKKGAFVISLDFEMMWGCHDWAAPDGYGETNIRQVRNVIKRLLELFDKYRINATFATVGLLFLDDKEHVYSNMPSNTPTYKNSFLSPFKDDYIKNIKEEYSELYFAPDVIKILSDKSNIEIGTHTFSHFYCWEQGQTIAQFESDIKKAVQVADLKGNKIRSIVFPKNQVSSQYLEICSKYGITNYRGNALHFYNETSSTFKSLMNRIMRLLDAYLPCDKDVTISYDSIETQNKLINIRASRFLRPYSKKLSWLEKLRFTRIKKEMKHAAINGELYHLWWHPHNFGSNSEENLLFLEKILSFYQDCHNNYGMQSMTMSEFEDFITNK